MPRVGSSRSRSEMSGPGSGRDTVSDPGDEVGRSGHRSVGFEPVKVGPRRRRVDPVVIGALVVVIGLLAAIVKPWQGGPSARVSPEAFSSAAASPTSSGAGASPTETPTIAEPDPSRGPLLVPGWSDVAPTAGVHHKWGIRVITAGYSPGTVGGQGKFAGQWYPHVRDGGPPTRIDPVNDARLAIGITFPRDSVPIDVRFWRLHDTGGLEWLPTYPLNDIPGQGAYTYLQRTGDGTVVPWGAGRYRLEILVGGAIHSWRIDIPDRHGTTPDPDPWPEPASVSPTPPLETVRTDLVGLFALADGATFSLAGESGPTLDAAGAWLDIDRGPNATGRSHVASAYLPDTTALGVTVPDGGAVISGEMYRVSPAGDDDTVFEEFDNGGPTILFDTPGGSALRSGVYALRVIWAAAGDNHIATWHVELRPGPVQPAPRLLAAFRAWSGFAGRNGLILGTTKGDRGEPSDGTVRVLPLASGKAPLYPAANGLGCDGPAVDGRLEVIGFAHAPDQWPDIVTARALFAGGRSVDVPLLVASDVAGLALLAPADTAELPPGVYRLLFAGGPEGLSSRNLTFCLGVTAQG
jgi:hypothetical protein